MDIETHSWVLWVGVIAVVFHVMEEYAFGWVAWANEKVGPRFDVTFTETDFLLGGVGMIFIALAGAAIGWWAPAVSLAVPAVFVLNAIFFHMIPSARDERLSPGTLSAVFIYLPVAAWMFWAAGTDDQLNFGTFVLAFVIGAAIIAFPIALIVLRDRFHWEAQTVSAAASSTAAATSDDGVSRPEEAKFEETPSEQVEEQIEELPVETDEGSATTVLVSDPELPGDEPTRVDPAPAGDEPTQLDAAPADPDGPGEDETTELRRH